MTVSVFSLQKLMSLGLTTEQMAGVIDVLAVELAPLETMRRKATDRQQRYRQRDCNVTDDVSSPTPLDIDINNTTQGNNNPTPTPSLPKNSRHHGTNPRAIGTNPRAVEREPDEFKAFWDAYPKRDGNADRKGAVKAFGAAAKRADGHEVLIRSAARYAAHCREKGKIGTEFVKQARSWLNGDLWREWVPQEPDREITDSRAYVQTGTDAMDAWDAYYKRTKGKMAPRDQRGGWYFPTEYPPQEQAA